MCDQKMPGFFARQAIYSQGRRMLRQQAAQACSCHLPARPPLTPTQVAQRFLAGVGVVVLMASVNFIEHAVFYVLLVLFVAISATAVLVTVQRRRRRRPVIPAPLPAGPPRTSVTGVTVRAIGPHAANADLTAALQSSRTKGTQ